MTKTNVGFLIITLMLLTLIGFYPTYISKFPSFENVTTVQHFHGVMMMLWFLLLVIQPFLIKYNKLALHRILGKASYAIAPLVMYSIFVASKYEYYRDITQGTKEESLAGLALDMTSIIAFGICYILAIINKKITPLHMRYMVGTALIIMAPGIVRIILIYQPFGVINFPTGVLYTFIICLGITLGLLANDLIKRRPYIPYLVVVGLTVGVYLTFVSRFSDWWQWVAGGIAQAF